MSGIRMTDSDRLIKLIEQMESQPEITCPRLNESESCIGCKYAINKHLCDMSARKADYLIANGVILPTCKAGDKVYIENRPMLISFLHIENEVTYVVHFDCDDCGDCPFYVDDVSFEGEHDCRTMGYIEFTEKDIGKTVFLTKEEAEEKLRELREKV